MAKTQAPSNMYPELNDLLLEGKPLVVRNTFIDVETPVLEVVARRSVSAPVPSRSRNNSSFSEADDEPRVLNEPLHEARRRAFLSTVEADAGVSQTMSDSATSSSRASPTSATGCDTVVAKSLSVSSSKSIKLDGRDAELASNASTRAASPSNRSLLSNPSKFSYETSFTSFAQSFGEEEEEEGETTFELRGLPTSMTRLCFEELMDSEGFAGKYNFVYLQADVKAGGCYGQGIINLVSPSEAARFQEHFHGFQWPSAGLEPMGVHTSEALQGLEDLIERYRNSPLMHKSVPVEMRPALYRNGAAVAFPSPTVRLRPVRVRGSQNRKLPGQQREAGSRIV